MITIKIEERLSYQNIAVLQNLVTKNWVLKDVTIQYNPKKGILASYKSWPFKARFIILGCDDVELYISTLSVGCHCKSAESTAEILDFLGVSYDEEDIFTCNKMGDDGYIRINYTP